MAEDSTLMTTMESQRMNPVISARKRPTRNEKLLLDDFIHFLHTRQSINLTVNQLNQIIRIHGFKKIHHAQKKVLVEAVDSLNLVEIQRSTLRQNVSAFAVLTVEDVVADLADLNWQECCVTSMEKLSSSSNINNNDNVSYFSSDQHSLQLANQSQSQSQPQPQPQPHSEKLLSPKRKKRINGVHGGGLMPEPYRSSVQASKIMPRRRKKSNVNTPTTAANAAIASTTVVDSASLASS